MTDELPPETRGLMVDAPPRQVLCQALVVRGRLVLIGNGQATSRLYWAGQCGAALLWSLAARQDSVTVRRIIACGKINRAEA